MKRLFHMFVATALLAIFGGKVLAQPCTCGCGKDFSQCDPSCAASQQFRQQQQQPQPVLHRQITVLGKADGQTEGDKPFGYADTARGVMSLNVMGRKDIRTLNANWHATYQAPAADEDDHTPYKKQVWEFVAESDPAGNSPGDVIGRGKATITGDENGATGWISGLKVVTNTGTLMNVRFQVQFVGSKLQLTGFQEVVSK